MAGRRRSKLHGCDLLAPDRFARTRRHLHPQTHCLHVLEKLNRARSNVAVSRVELCQTVSQVVRTVLFADVVGEAWPVQDCNAAMGALRVALARVQALEVALADVLFRLHGDPLSAIDQSQGQSWDAHEREGFR